MSAYATTSDPYDADQVAKSCLFLPSTNVDLKVVDHLADVAVTNGIGDTFALPFYQDCKALAEYRLGNYSEAIEWAQKPLRIPGIYVHGHTYATLALAYWQLGAKTKAHEMLAKGEALDPSIMPANVAQDPSNTWLAWLFARLQLDEAAAFIQHESTVTADSTNP
jgi:tetratricopeptide (TPR) repeat protein